MSLPHILLGMLREPASGYELKQRFEQSVRHFWSAELSQIYPALKRLEREGHLESVTRPSDKGPPRTVYRRTETGAEHLRQWLGAGPVCRTERIDYLSQVFFLDELPARERRKFMAALKNDFESRLETLREVERQWQAEDSRYPERLPPRERYKQMTLRLGLLKYAATVAWCEECLERM